MMAADPVVDVNEINFEYEVVSFSQNLPVLVDFWAEWCQPCKVLGPLLEKLVREAEGNLRLAKVNIDQNPNLALRYGVRSIPTVKAFIEGQVAAEFVGAQPEARLREFIAKLTPPGPLDLEIEKGLGLLASQQWSQSETILRKAILSNPESTAVQLALAKTLLAQGKAEESTQLLKSISSGREFNRAQVLLPYAHCLLQLKMGDLPGESDLEAIFTNSVRLASQAKFPIALDGLLDILRADKHFKHDLAKQVILAILEIMGEQDEQTRAYRAELASTLF